MTDSKLAQAQLALKMRNLSLRSASMGVADDLICPMADHPSVQTQYRHFVTKSEVISESGDPEVGPFIFRVYVDLGVRWIFSEKNSKRPSAKGGFAKGNELGKIEAIFVAEYALSKTIPKECLDAFALNNASYHVWPYWREFLSSACQRLDAPKVVLPFLQMAGNSDADDSPDKRKSSVTTPTTSKKSIENSLRKEPAKKGTKKRNVAR